MGRYYYLILVVLAMALLIGSPNVAAAGMTNMDCNLKNAYASFVGEEDFDLSGYSVAIAGDVNGDGYDDILIGAMFNSQAWRLRGQVYLIFGSASGWSMHKDLSNADASFLGQGPDARAGSSVSGAGDVNGDGYDDILIGALGDVRGGEAAGQAYLIFGKSSGWTMDKGLSSANASFVGENAGDFAGSAVKGVGDVNGDGYDDILIGAYNNDAGGNNAGQTYLILGKASGWSMYTDLSKADASFWGEKGGDYAGMSIGGAGDVNNDGYDDFVIGAPYHDLGAFDAGLTYLILGKNTGWKMDTRLSKANASFHGENSEDRSGWSVACSGDVNGDGFDDILIGAYNNDEGGAGAGQTYLILGMSTGWAKGTNLSTSDASFVGETGGDWSGWSIANDGDVDNDGFDDILIGARENTEGGAPYAGQTYLILGMSTGWSMDTDLSSSDASYIGQGKSDRSGCSVSMAGDINNDSQDDILIGADSNGRGGDTAGQTYLILYVEPPYWTSVPDLHAVEDIPYVHDFSGQVYDSDTPLGDLVITSSSPYVTSIDGMNVTFMFREGVVTADIRLNLTDSYFTVPTTVKFSVQPVNDPPGHNLQDDYTATEDIPWTMDLSPHIWDEDNEMEELTLMVSSPYASVDGFILTMLFPEGVIEYSLQFRIFDGINMTLVVIHFTVTPVDDPPEVSDLGIFLVREDQTMVFNITSYLSDVDTPIEDLHIVVRDANCTVVGQELHFHYDRGGGNHSISVEVSDSRTMVKAVLLVRVEEVNDPPMIAEIPSRQIQEDVETTIDLTSYVSDEDTPFEELVLKCNHPDVLSVEGFVITMLYATEKDDHIVDVMVYDGHDRTSGGFYVQILKVNDLPVILSLDGQLPPFAFEFDEGTTRWLVLETYDEEGGALAYRYSGIWSGVEIHPNGTVSIVCSPTDEGEYHGTLTVTDPEGGSSSADMTVAVIYVNDPPSITTELGMTQEANEDERFHLVLTGEDEDTNPTWSDDTDLFDISPQEGIIDFIPSQDEVGEWSVTVILTDVGGLTNEVSFRFVVNNVNDVPVILATSPANGSRFKEGGTITFSVNATDEDGDEVTVTWISDGVTLGTGETLVYKELKPGTRTIKVTVSDGEASVEDEFTIVIQKEEESPALGGAFVLLAMLVGMAATMMRRKYKL